MSSISVTTDSVTASPANDDATELTRAILYLVLSRAFSAPGEMAPADPARLRRVTQELPQPLQKTAVALADAWEHGLTHRQGLSLAYARLFLGPFEILASPYASFYLQTDQQLMGPVSQSVAGAYAEAGLEPGPGPREAPDHVSLEWEFMYFLTHQHLATGAPQWLERRHVFVSTHLARWMPSLTDAIKRSEAHAFYDSLASLLTNVLNEPALL